MAAMRFLLIAALALGCGGDSKNDPAANDDGGPIEPPAATCNEAAGGGSADVAAPMLALELEDSWHEGWLASPAVADLDGDGDAEIIAARAERVVVWDSGGDVVKTLDVDGRIWSSPVIADLLPGEDGLEIAVAARDAVHLWKSDYSEASGFPVEWQNEMRSLAAGDIDGDGALELVAVTTSPLSGSDQRDIVMAWNADGSPVSGFPPNTSGSSGCDDMCYVTGGYDQNLALGDIDGDGDAEIFATQDNAYLSLHDGDGRAFAAAGIFSGRSKFQGMRFMLDLEEAKQGYADNEASSNQAHFTNSAPAIADLDGDDIGDLIVLSSVQNANQSDRERGVALWALRPDGTRLPGWEEPLHVPDYLVGLWDFEGVNVVAATNQVTVAEISGEDDGPELLFVDFDGRIHAASSSASILWSHRYTNSDRVLSAGLAVADLSGDGAPEVVYATYSPDEGNAKLVTLDGGGNELHAVELPGRGAMSVPTIADTDGDGAPEILVALKNGESGQPHVLVYSVASASDNCLLWATGRGNLQRNGFVP